MPRSPKHSTAISDININSNMQTFIFSSKKRLCWQVLQAPNLVFFFPPLGLTAFLQTLKSESGTLVHIQCKFSIQLQFFKIMRCLVEHLILVSTGEIISENTAYKVYCFMLLIKLSNKLIKAILKPLSISSWDI